MAEKMTEAQRRNLEHVRDHGCPLPASKAGYYCRIKGLSEFLWEFEDGSIASTREQPSRKGNRLVRVVGEQLTPAGRSALASTGGADD